jgi:tetratricopeptide (TPR) repeat protein
MNRQDDLRNLIRNHTRRLQKLKEQQASIGPLHTPVHILTEIEDTEAEIHRLQTELAEIESGADTLAQRVKAQRRRIAEGLDELRQQATTAPAFEQRQIRVVGRLPLGTVEHFKDRVRECEQIGELLASPSTRLVSVIGHGGMGKTALASKVLRDLERHRWPHTDDDIPLDGIVYLSTRTAGISLERLFLDCAKLLGGESEKRLNAIWTNPQLDTGDKIARLLESLKDGRYVILLDNLEDLLDEQGQFVDENLQLFFDRSLTTDHGGRLLVTSRIILAFRREVMRFDRQVKLLGGLPIPDGVALLRELDPNGDYGLRDATEQDLTQAVSLVHGVPRALEVMAGILANDPFATLAEVLEQFYEQEDVVQALIEENYKRLDDNARRVIEALAVFKRPVPPLAVDYLLEPFFPGLDVPGVLRRLTRSNIVSVDRATKTVTLHPIDQDYAYSQLPDEGEYSRPVLERRAADYYVQLRTPEETWKSIDDLEPQLVEFEHRIRAGDCDGAYQVIDPIDYNYLYLWGYYLRLRELQERLSGQLVHPASQMGNLGSLGRICRMQRQYEQAIEFHEQALNIAHEIGNTREKIHQLSHLGLAYRGLSQFEQAFEYFGQSLAMARKIDDRKEVASQLAHLGLNHYVLGKIEQAKEYFEEALAIDREEGNSREEAVHLNDLGRAYHSLGQFELAVESYNEALGISQKIGYRQREVILFSNLGDTYRTLGQINESIKFYEDALTNAREIGYDFGESLQLVGLGWASLASGDLYNALRYCIDALALDSPETNCQGTLILGIVQLHQRDPNAKKTFSDATTRCQILLEKTSGLYRPHYFLAETLMGQAICDPLWVEEDKRAKLLTPSLNEYKYALEICSAPGVVQDAIRDLKLIQTAGIEGLEPVFELLEGALEQEVDPDKP